MVASNQAKGGSLKIAVEKCRLEGKSGLNEYQRKLIDWSENVDKAYAWVVLTALFIMMAATLGSYRIYGLLFAVVTEQKVYTRAEATWPVSTIFTVENLIGPMVSVVTYYITFRQSMFFGGLLLTLGNLGAWFSSSLWVDVLSVGIVQGVGYAFVFMPFMEIINNYFLRYRNMALGLALSGGTLSVFLWSPIAQWCLQNYEWRASYLLISAICSLNLLMVPLLKPNPRPNLQEHLNTNRNLNNNSNYNDEQQLEKNHNQGPESTKAMSRSSLSRLSRRALTYRNSIRHQTTVLVTRKTSINHKSGLRRQESVISMNPFASTAGLERQISTIATACDPTAVVTGTVPSSQLSSGARRPSSCFIAREPSIIEGQQHGSIAPAPTNMETSNSNSNNSNNHHPSLARLTSMGTQASLYQQSFECNPELDTTEHYETLSLSEMGEKLMNESEFDSSLVWEILKKPAFHLIWFNELIYFWVFSIYCLVLADLGRDRGCTKSQADSLLSFQSLGELIGRIGLTILVDLRYLSSKNVVTLVLFLICGCLITVTQISGFLWMASLTATTSALTALLYITLNGLLVDYLGERQVTLGYGMCSCIAGIFMYFRPQAVGLFRDRLGSYDWLLISLGLACALGGLLWILEPLLTRCLCGRQASANHHDQDQGRGCSSALASELPSLGPAPLKQRRPEQAEHDDIELDLDSVDHKTTNNNNNNNQNKPASTNPV